MERNLEPRSRDREREIFFFLHFPFGIHVVVFLVRELIVRWDEKARSGDGTREWVGTNAFAISWLWQRSLSIHTTMRRDINYEILR